MRTSEARKRPQDCPVQRPGGVPPKWIVSGAMIDPRRSEIVAGGREITPGKPCSGQKRIEIALPASDRGPILLMSYWGLDAVMTTMRKLTTRVSTKGQVILPKELRERRRWTTGTELIVEETPEGVLLRAKPAFAASRPEDVFGSLPYRGPAKSIAEMNDAIAGEVKRRHARHRY